MCVGLVFTFGLMEVGCKNQSSNGTVDELFKQGDHIIKKAVEDVDGNKYDAVKLGEQVWMAENLRTKSKAKPYPKDIDIKEWPEEFYYALGDDPEIDVKLSARGCSDDVYYNVFAARSQSICPEGWRVPSKSDVEQLLDYLPTQKEYISGNSEYNVAKSLASASSEWTHYSNPSEDEYAHVGCNPINTNNATGFNARPKGSMSRYSGRISSDNISRVYLSYTSVLAIFWTSTENNELGISNYCFGFNYGNSNVLTEFEEGRLSTSESFVPIRCIKESE